MALKQSKLQQIPQRNKDLAFGYVHDHERNHKNVIPYLVTHSCLGYINQDKDKIISLSTNNVSKDELLKIADWNEKGVQFKKTGIDYVIDEELILENRVCDSINEWKFKINAKGCSMDTIGIKTIRNASSCIPAISYSILLNNNGLWRRTQGDTPSKQMRQSFFDCDQEKLNITKGDTITMRLNCNDWTLEFQVNENGFSRVFQECGIEKSPYSARIGLCHCNNGAKFDYELISFQNFY